MKKYILPIIVGIVMGIVGFIIGYQTFANDYSENQFNKTDTIENNDSPLNIIDNSSKKVKDLSYEELKKALLKKEKDNILKYIDIYGVIETKKEGPMFNKVYVDYFSGYITNKAILLPVKDIKVKISFYSYTDALIGSKTIVIYNFIRSNDMNRFAVKINVPESTSSIKYKILKAKSAEKDLEKMNVGC